MPDMKHKKGLYIGIGVSLMLVILGFVYLWSLGVFSGSAGIGDRNAAVEAAVTRTLTERLKTVFSEEEDLSLAEAKSFAAIYTSRYPKADYPEEAGIPAETVDRAIAQEHNHITVELTFEGPRLTFQEYKAFVYRVMEVLRQRMDWIPLQMQLFYRRYPEGEETESVAAYESKIPNYLFGQDQKTVVTSSGTHFMIELDETTETKVKAYYTTKYIYLAVVSLTVIGLSALFLVRQIKKHRKKGKK